MRLAKAVVFLSVLVIGLAVPRDGWAQTPVTDVAALAQRITVIAQQAEAWYQRYEQLEATRRSWERLKNLPQRYRARYTASWRHQTPRDAYLLAEAWSRAMNDGNPATIALGHDRVSYENAIYRLSAGDRRRFGNSQAEVQNNAVHVDLMDNSIRDSLRAIGTYRQEAEQLDRQLNEVYSDLLGPEQERDGLLQKTALATTIAAHQARYTNRLLGATLEQQALATQGQRDLKARSINAAVYAQQARASIWRFSQSQDIRTGVGF